MFLLHLLIYAVNQLLLRTTLDLSGLKGQSRFPHAGVPQRLCSPGPGPRGRQWLPSHVPCPS